MKICTVAQEQLEHLRSNGLGWVADELTAALNQEKEVRGWYRPYTETEQLQMIKDALEEVKGVEDMIKAINGSDVLKVIHV